MDAFRVEWKGHQETYNTATELETLFVQLSLSHKLIAICCASSATGTESSVLHLPVTVSKCLLPALELLVVPPILLKHTVCKNLPGNNTERRTNVRPPLLLNVRGSTRQCRRGWRKNAPSASKRKNWPRCLASRGDEAEGEGEGDDVFVQQPISFELSR